MGYIKHHTIVVTSWNRNLLEQAQKEARIIFSREFFGEYNGADDLVSSIVSGVVNSYESFFIAPDGSKESWEASKNGDTARELFIKWINSKAHEDGSNSISYVEVFFGDDNGKAEILNHN